MLRKRVFFKLNQAAINAIVRRDVINDQNSMKNEFLDEEIRRCDQATSKTKKSEIATG